MITLLRHKNIPNAAYRNGNSDLHVVVTDSKDSHTAYYQVYITCPNADWTTFLSEMVFDSDEKAIKAFEIGVAA